MHLSIEELLHYTDEERERWERWFRENGEDLLKTPIVGHDENTAGALILHIFGPELRYVQRLRDEPLTQYRGRPSQTIEQVFGFGLETRKAMREFVCAAEPKDWTRVVELNIAGHTRRATVRKIILHTLIHEIRHWAQMARIMRERGLEPPGGHDLLMSSALF
jgi:uncharacterized damage-inducible protein DinB